ncbi:hypothetical protein BDZ97DRAFT_1828366, partial [Flammula alnicola]
PTGVTSFLLPGDKDASCIFLSPFALFSAALVAFGCVARQMCFREMGRRFTYHLTIVENHTLVTTGPYNIVRHPSYTGRIACTRGAVIPCRSRLLVERERVV